MPSTSYSQDTDLAKYFTDVEPLRAWFEQTVASEVLPKRLLVIWGVGGIGKSSLLGMFRLHCRDKRVPVGLASGDEAKSAVDVMARWGQDLKSDGANLRTFFKTYEHYRAIQAKVEDKAKEANKKWGDAASKAAGKAAEAGAAAAVGAVVGSMIPGIGTVAGAVGGMGAEALVDWLRGFLTKPDIDLLLDPSKKLTEDFLADVNELASKKRVVLMLDTYEQMTALDDWTRDVAQRINSNVLMVIAGRAMLDWARQWPAWLAYAQVEELKPMTKRVMHELIRKYYATMRGGEPNPKQVNAIIEFSGGLPMVVNTAVQLWVKYGVEDFGAVKGEVVRAVVKRLREGVPPELYPLLETAAALRYFNKDILRTVSGMGDISAGYEELLRFPFVRRRAEGYALHDRVREMIEENVRTDDPTKYRNVHERADAYFEERMMKSASEEAEQLGLERLYHRVCADEENGSKLFQGMAEELTRYRLVSKLRALINDMNTYPLERADSILWREYYEARLAHLETRLTDAEKVYQMIGENKDAPKKLRAYASCDWSNILRKRGKDTYATILETALSLIPLDSKIVYSLFDLSAAFRWRGNLRQALDEIERARNFFEESHDILGIATAYEAMKIFGLKVGDWWLAFDCQSKALEMLPQLDRVTFIRSEILGSFGYEWGWTGRLYETERKILEALSVAQRLDLLDDTGLVRSLGVIAGLQGKYNDSTHCFEDSISRSKDLYFSTGGAQGITYGLWAIILTRQARFNEALDYFGRYFEFRRAYSETSWTPEALNAIGILYETMQNFQDAGAYYQELLSLSEARRYYFTSAAYTGHVRVHHAQSDYADIPPLLAEAEQLAQQYEYNDHLASLRLTQGHIAWDGHFPEWDKGFDAALGFYKLALVYALRFNRFLLDEVLSGRPQGTPLRPIIPECLKRGESGLKMLLALSAWWQTGMNDVGTPRPDTISPIPENIALLEAEKIARDREPGDGSTQKTFLEQIENALKQF